MRNSVLLLLWLVFLSSTHFTGAEEIIDSFPSPASEPRGLAWDGEYLWCADAGTDSVYKIDASDGTVVSSFPFSIEPHYGGIAWSDDNSVWIANGSLIYKVNPVNGDVISSFSCPGG